MSDASERFLDRLTQSFLPNHELASRARTGIEARLKPDQEGRVMAATRRLEQADRSGWKPVWTIWLLTGMTLIALTFIGLILLFAALMGSLAMPLLHLEESHWVGQDTLFKLDPSVTAINPYEAEISLRMKARLLDILAPLESLPR